MTMIPVKAVVAQCKKKAICVLCGIDEHELILKDSNK